MPKKTMTDFEYQCLQTLVAAYGADEVIDTVREIAAQAEEDSDES
jgi:hypothetical protein